jgi:hypothetical protein
MPDTPVNVTSCSLGSPLESAVTLTLVRAPDAPTAPVAPKSGSTDLDRAAASVGFAGWRHVLQEAVPATPANRNARLEEELDLESLGVFKAEDLAFEFHKRSAMEAASLESDAESPEDDRRELAVPQVETWSRFL